MSAPRCLPRRTEPEDTRSYGAGRAAAAAAGLTVIECEQLTRATRRGKGKSDPIDAHLAVLTALQLNADKLLTLRADGGREALRILVCARQELTTTSTAQTNRLCDGDDPDRRLARFSDAVLAALARRRQPAGASRQQAARPAEISSARPGAAPGGPRAQGQPHRAGRDRQ